ncbi:MAG: RNA polymerase sigma factor [Bacteroidota bacterium]
MTELIMTKREFQQAVAPIRDKLYRFALRMMNNIPEAEDVVQEVLIKLWQQRERLLQVTNLEAWSVRMTRNVSVDKLRTRKQTDDVDQLVNVETDLRTPDLLAEEKDTFLIVQQAIQELPEKQRLVMHLRDIEEHSYQEIAEALEMPMNQVKVNLFRARKKVREVLLKSKIQ